MPLSHPIHVCWHEGTDGFTKTQGRSGYSCCTMLNQMFDHYECEHWSTFQNMPTTVDGAVVIIQGGNERFRVQEINDDLAKLRWAIVVVIGDEGCDFPLDQLQLTERQKVWFQYPQPEHTKAHRYFIVGYSRETPRLARRDVPRVHDWFFAGQNTHIRRQQCVDQLKTMAHGVLMPTKGFGQGISHEEYFDLMAQSRVIPCPSGPASPDSFRFAEAMECGCVPIVDGNTPRYSSSAYWDMVFRAMTPPPFPIIYDWETLPTVMAQTLERWEELTAECQEWWENYRSFFNCWLGIDVSYLRGRHAA